MSCFFIVFKNKLNNVRINLYLLHMNFQNKNLENKSGFTLIELLVVIAIIGLLASISLTGLDRIRARARDTLRITHLKDLQLALQSYYDAVGSYPEPSRGWNMWSGHCTNYGNNDNYIVGLAPTYMPALPLDPIYDTGSNCYIYYADAGGQNYMVYATHSLYSDHFLSWAL